MACQAAFLVTPKPGIPFTGTAAEQPRHPGSNLRHIQQLCHLQTHAEETLEEPARLGNLYILAAGLSQEPQVGLEVLSNLTNAGSLRKLADEQFSGLLYILGAGLSLGCQRI